METINVAVRIRPTASTESIGIDVISQNPPVLFVKDRLQSYCFDSIYTKDATQARIYKETVKPLVDRVLKGYNCTVFAYGQTGSGKTYTIGSDPQSYKDAGFIGRILNSIFDNREAQIDISISFFEIYNEKVFDLLGNSKVALQVKGFQVLGLTLEKVNSSDMAQKLLKLGSENRHTGETKQNSNSSRSHAIFSIYCNVKHETIQTCAKINLVDLAGSENVRKTGNKGVSFAEGVNINMGLLHVGMVINALSTNMPHIPYRQSLLTTILQDSLDKKNYITLVVCISPDIEDKNETIQSLEFAERAKKLRNKPEINCIIQQYKKHNPNLFERQGQGSAVKVQPTPMKRQHQSLLCSETPRIAKKTKPNETWTPSTSTRALNSNMEIPPPLYSLNVSPINDMDGTPPMLRKYADVFSSRMVDIINTRFRVTPNKPNTPKFCWQQLRSEVTQIVRQEMKEFTSLAARACSSPINLDDSSNNTVAKRLNFDNTSLVEEITVNKLIAEQNVGELPTKLETFKLPVGRPKRNRNIIKEGIPKPDLEKSQSTQMNRSATDEDIGSVTMGTLRRSIRLSMKADRTTNVLEKTILTNDKSDHSPTLVGRKSINTRKPVNKAFAVTHNQDILRTLNTGTLKQLETLASIGAKTASQIHIYRQLNGPFNTISELRKMPWRGNHFQKFLTANFITFEDDQ